MSSSRSSSWPARSTARPCAAPPRTSWTGTPRCAPASALPDGRAVQIVAGRLEVPWHEVDLSARDAEAQRSLVDAVTAEERARRFDLARPPLVRCALVRLGHDRGLLVLTFHHIVADGWSLPVLHRELMASYGAAPAALPEVAPYRDYLRRLSAADRDAARAAWRTALAGFDEPTRLVDVPADGGPLGSEQVRIELSEHVTARLAARAREHGVTLGTVVQSAWGLLLGRLTGRQDVVFGTTVSGRDAEVDGIESMVGLFINTLPTRFRWEPADTLAGLVGSSRTSRPGSWTTGISVSPRSSASPGSRAAANSSTRSSSSRTTRRHRPRRPLRHGPHHRARVPRRRPLPARPDRQAGPRLDLRLKHHVRRLDGEAVRRIADRLTRILQALAADPGQIVAGVDLLSGGEHARALPEGRAGPSPRRLWPPPSRPRRPAPRGPRRSSTTARASPTRSWTRAPRRWPASCAPGAPGRNGSSRSPCRVRRN
ncbi:condensation domain-containing protein [Streptosporangium lutulentum]